MIKIIKALGLIFKDNFNSKKSYHKRGYEEIT